jgi:hypothetical protein
MKTTVLSIIIFASTCAVSFAQVTILPENYTLPESDRHFP